VEKGELYARWAHVLIVDCLPGAVVVHVDDGHRVDETLLAVARQCHVEADLAPEATAASVHTSAAATASTAEV
jgi:hypothetical protein